MKSLKDFDKFLCSGSRSNPFIAIRQNGQIAFSMGAVNKYKLDYKYVILWMSKDKLTIAVQFTNDPNEDGAILVQKRVGNFSFSAGTFLNLYDIAHTKTKNHKFTWNPSDRIAFFYPKGDPINYKVDKIRSKINEVVDKKQRPYSIKNKAACV